MLKKKEILIIFGLAVLITISSLFLGSSFGERGLPCPFYYDLSFRSPFIYGIYRRYDCPFLFLRFPQNMAAFLRRLEVSWGHHTLNAFFFVDLLFWALVLAVGWWLMRRDKMKKGEILIILGLAVLATFVYLWWEQRNVQWMLPVGGFPYPGPLSFFAGYVWWFPLVVFLRWFVSLIIGWLILRLVLRKIKRRQSLR